jgi:hypothetical protein
MTWNVYEVAADHEYRIGDKNVAYFRVLSTGRRGEDKARATLAASAPKLLKATESLLALWAAQAKTGAAPSQEAWKLIAKECEKAAAIINRAKGETP